MTYLDIGSHMLVSEDLAGQDLNGKSTRYDIIYRTLNKGAPGHSIKYHCVGSGLRGLLDLDPDPVA